MEKDDLTQLQALRSVFVVEIKLDFLCVPVDFREFDDKISSHSKLQISMLNFVPSAIKHVPNVNLYFRGRLAWMITRALKSNTFEHKFFVEFDLDPGSLVVLYVPFVPLFLAWTEQVLRVAANGMVLSSHTRAVM